MRLNWAMYDTVEIELDSERPGTFHMRVEYPREEGKGIDSWSSFGPAAQSAGIVFAGAYPSSVREGMAVASLTYTYDHASYTPMPTRVGDRLQVPDIAAVMSVLHPQSELWFHLDRIIHSLMYTEDI